MTHIVEKIKISELVKELEEKSEKSLEDFGQVKATLLVNYGEEGRNIKKLITQNQTTLQMLMTILEHYETELAILKKCLLQQQNANIELSNSLQSSPERGVSVEALSSVIWERKHQDIKWGEQNHRPHTWIVALQEELGETCKNILECEPRKYRNEMVQVAAVALAAIECYDRHNYSISDFKKWR